MTRIAAQPNELRRGDVVNIVHSNVVFDHLSQHGHGLYDKNGILICLCPNTKIYVVRRAPTYPPNYPPQTGDVWANNTGRLYFFTGGRVQTDGGYGYDQAEILAAMTNLSAGYKLLFRKEI